MVAEESSQTPVKYSQSFLEVTTTILASGLLSFILTPTRLTPFPPTILRPYVLQGMWFPDGRDGGGAGEINRDGERREERLVKRERNVSDGRNRGSWKGKGGRSGWSTTGKTV